MQYPIDAASTGISSLTLGPVLDLPFITRKPHPTFNTPVCLWQWSKDKSMPHTSSLQFFHYINRSVIVNEIMLSKCFVCLWPKKKKRKKEALFERIIVPLALISDLSLTHVPSVEKKQLAIKRFKKHWKLCPTGKTLGMTQHTVKYHQFPLWFCQPKLKCWWSF